MPVTEPQVNYISDLFEQCACDENEVMAMLDEVAGIKGGEWPKDAEKLSWATASELIDALKDLKRDRDRPSGRREYGR